MRRTGTVLRTLIGLFFIFSAIGMLVERETVAQDLQIAQWFLVLVTMVKIAGGLGMLASYWFRRLAIASGTIFMIVMAGALVTHIRIDDPISTMITPAVLLILSAVVTALTFWQDLELRDTVANRIAVSPEFIERRQTHV